MGTPATARGLVSNKYARRFLQTEAMRRRATLLPYAPLQVYVDPCNACDLACTFCPQSDWGDRARGMMKMDIFERVLAELVELRPRQVYLFCYGEALLHKKIFEMIRAVVDAGLEAKIHTNAKSLNEERALELLESGLQELHFSFDTANEDDYNRMRVRSDFDLVVGNIRRFLELKRQRGSKHPVVYLQELVPYAKDARPVTSDAYRALFDGYDVVYDPRFMHNFAGMSNETEFKRREDEGTSICSQIYTRIVVTFDGKVHACCLDSEGYNIVGDLAAGDTIASAWNSTAMQELRRRTGARDLDGLKPCDECDMLRRRPKKEPTGARRVVGEALWRLTEKG